MSGTKDNLKQPLITGEPKKAKEEKPRVIFVNDAPANRPFKFKGNNISTTKYNVITFVPKNFVEQFSRVANVYFLFIALLQLVPGVSPTGRFTTLVPLSFVILCSAIKDLFEDWKRRMSDLETNSKKTHVLREGVFQQVYWSQVHTGDIIKINDKEPFPADIIMFASSDSQGICYVETSSLDGETNLKIKRAKPGTLHVSSADAAAAFHGKMECEQPNNDILKFKGTLMIEEQKVALDQEQCLLRGSSLRNTHWIIGCVVFTGHDSKLMMNRNKTPVKNSNVERMTNKLIFFLLGLEVALCLICAAGVMIITGSFAGNWWYFYNVFSYHSHVTPGGVIWEGFKSFWTFLILFNNLIPISLYVSVEIAKVMQGFFISKDLHMYYPENDTPSTVRTSALNEDLGQIEYIFSDKTGTLTANRMDFLKFAVSGVAYGTGITEIARAAAKREGKILIDDRPDDWNPDSADKFYDARISKGAWKQQPNKNDIEEFLRLLAVCHTVIPEANPDDPTDIIYQASSPDEAALVKGAKYLGAEFKSRTNSDMTIEMNGQNMKYDVLDVIEFTSARKRMSIIVRDPSGKLILYCKGADSIIYPLLQANQPYAQETLQLLENFAKDGLRTLVVARAYLDENEYAAWTKEYADAKCSFVDRDSKIELVSEKIERHLELVGVTAIEDKLQDGVGDTIATLAQAGIKIWVLTGDKQETAINIGFACDLLNNTMALIVVEGDNFHAIEACIHKNLNALTESSKDRTTEVLAMIVDGQRLKIILEHPELAMQFLKLGVQCKAVICCRVSPKQKADVVSLVKKNIVDAITLAIGDGANDVSMIQAAHVGIGISGEEGLQAANAADYAIAQFRFLKRLLLVHGRWSYRRNSKLVLYCFYKNIVLYLTQFWYVFINGFSGTSIHDKWNVSFYNVLFTFFPIMALAVFDRDLKAEVAEDYPILYEQGHKNTFFNTKVFLGWTINGIWHSFVCFIIPIFCLSQQQFPVDGQDLSLMGYGITIYTAVIFVVNFKVVIETSSFTVINWLTIVFSIAIWFVFVVVYGAGGWLWWLLGVNVIFPFDEFNEIFNEFRIFGTFTFWSTVLITVAVALLRDVFWKCWTRLNSRSFLTKLYYEVQQTAGRRTKEEVMDSFPIEELQELSKKPIIKEKRNLFELPDVKNLFKNITGIQLSQYTGYAFSQTETGQADLITHVNPERVTVTSELLNTGQLIRNKI